MCCGGRGSHRRLPGPRLARRLADLASDGIDVFWNTSTHHDLDVAVHAVTASGKVVITAGTGADAALPVGPFYVRDISVHGFVISRARPATPRTRPG
jgi:NADPH2:quinone reductase